MHGLDDLEDCPWLFKVLPQLEAQAQLVDGHIV